LQKALTTTTGRLEVPITAKQVNEASGSSEANVARERTARSGGVVRENAKPVPKSYRSKQGQPDPTKSVEAERARRAAGARTPGGAPKVSTKAGGPSSRPERASPKTWSRAGEKNQRERAGRR
jgi:hypothetical protein